MLFSRACMVIWKIRTEEKYDEWEMKKSRLVLGSRGVECVFRVLAPGVEYYC